jgi:phospholipid/cholesterol/gamma-HCH transport system substrate-binding protein
VKWEQGDLAVGALVLGAVAIALGSTIWFAPAVTDTTVTYYTEFDRIEGMAVQSEVRLRGFTVGRVSAIEPVRAKNGYRFRVAMRLDARLENGDRFEVPRGTTAQLVPPAVLGAASIALESPDSATGNLAPGSTIPGTRSTAVMDQLNKLAGDLNTDVRRVIVSTLGLLDSLKRTATVATSALSAAEGAVRTTQDALPRLFASVERDLATADTLLKGLQQVTPATLKVADSVALLLSDSRKSLAQLTSLATSREPELSRIVANLDTSAVLLRHFAGEVSRSPMRAITGVMPPTPRDPPPTPRASGGSAGRTAAARDSARP